MLAVLLLFSYIAYIYLTLPDVRSLAKVNPTTTAFMQLRLDEARASSRRSCMNAVVVGFCLASGLTSGSVR